MPTFIDESGETGQRSPYFRLGAAWLPTLKAVEHFRAGMRAFQLETGLAGYEFKWSKGGRHRQAYYQEVMHYPFRFTVAAVDKSHAEWREAGASVIHWACVVSLAACLRPVYLAEEKRRSTESKKDHPLGELVIVDDNQDKKFLTIVKQKFREMRSGVRPSASLVGKVKFRGSGPDETIQLADMVCGAVGAYLDGDETCYNIIAENDLGITRIP